MGKKATSTKVTVNGKPGIVLGPPVIVKGKEVQEVGLKPGSSVYVPTKDL